jgi:hypothetical protein
MDKDGIRELLSGIAELLEAGREDSTAVMVRDALSSPEGTLERFLMSNELWGGAGSIADQSLIADTDRRKTLEGLLIGLGRLQTDTGKTNVRTEGWVAAFEQWRRAGFQ